MMNPPMKNSKWPQRQMSPMKCQLGGSSRSGFTACINAKWHQSCYLSLFTHPAIRHYYSDPDNIDIEDCEALEQVIERFFLHNCFVQKEGREQEFGRLIAYFGRNTMTPKTKRTLQNPTFGSVWFMKKVSTWLAQELFPSFC